jgi:hypothetical protein
LAFLRGFAPIVCGKDCVTRYKKVCAFIYRASTKYKPS